MDKFTKKSSCFNKKYFLHKVNKYFKYKDIIRCNINVKMYKKALKIRNIFKVDRFAEIYKKYNFIGLLNKLNCTENVEMLKNGLKEFVQRTLGVNDQYPKTELEDIFENSVDIYLKRKFIILHDGDSYNLYDLDRIFVFELQHYVKGDFPQFFYTRVNETDVINILLYKEDGIEFKTIHIVDNNVRKKETEYLDRTNVCEKLFQLKGNEFLQSAERKNFVLAFFQNISTIIKK